jgi:hypothetical protein
VSASAVRVVRVYCGNAVRWRGFFEDPEECSFEGYVPLPEAPEEDRFATWVCRGCGATNTVADHS